jgi:hypothetical protein
VNVAGAKHYLWSPSVHRRFGETCHFFLVKSRDCRGDILQKRLERIHAELSMRGVSTHVVLGPYDLLVRSWLSPSKRAAYFRALMDESDDLNLEVINEFSCDFVEYTWLEPGQVAQQQELADLDTKALDSLTELRRPLSEYVSAEPESFSSEEIGMLRSSGLLVEAIDTLPGASKVFLFLTNSNSSVQARRLHARMRDVALGAGFENVSVYYNGGGFCEYIVKGTLPAAFGPGAIDAISQIQDDLVTAGVTGWSLVPPKAHLEERSEGIAASEGEAVKALSRSIATARPVEIAPGDLISALEAHGVRSVLEAYFNSVRPWHGGAEAFVHLSPAARSADTRLRHIVSGVLSRERKIINREMSFLFAMGEDAKDVVTLLMTSSRVGPAEQIGRGVTPNGHISGEIAKLLSICSDHRAAESIVSEYIDLDSAAGFADAADLLLGQLLRGELFVEELRSSVNEDTIATLDLIAEVAVLQIGLEDLLQRLRRGN